MEALYANVFALIEQLEDARRFHDVEARFSNGVRRQRHRARSDAYAAMLVEIAYWESRHRGRDARHPRFTFDPTASAEDGYAALLERVYHIHAQAVPHKPFLYARATGDAMEGGATDGTRRAGLARC